MMNEISVIQENNQSKYISIPKVYKDIEGFEFLENEGNLFLRTTSILNHWVPPRLQNYMKTNSANAQTKKFQEAGNAGSAVHKFAEMSIDPLNLNPNELKMYDVAKASFLKFKSENDYKPLAYELTIASETMGVSGTIDLVCEYQGKLCIFDWKTSRYVGESARWQLSTYKYIFEEKYGEKINCVAVKLSKETPDYFKIEYRNYEMSLRAYLGILSAFQDNHYKTLMKIWPKYWNKDFSNLKHKEFV